MNNEELTVMLEECKNLKSKHAMLISDYGSRLNRLASSAEDEMCFEMQTLNLIENQIEKAEQDLHDKLHVLELHV